ncbi:YbgC/FadM family acyl-CoA thioesterase [Ideonella sp. YS5]|uniref:YbgC/FadM family acyl-CoA thioesterase n=1 Tax=Ideonella sp. YS5 TaxID=3453714 RepID=UPI003EECD776
MTRSDFRFLERLRVRWAEVDMQKIVFNGHYLMYIDTAVAGYWRALALPYEEVMHRLGGDLFVRKSTLEYFAAAAYDDVLDIGVRCERIGTSSMLFATGVFRGEELLVSGELVYVYADPVARAPQPVPPDLRSTLLGFEAGEAMVEVRVGSWEELGHDAGAIRAEVFIEEQKIPAEMEWDTADSGCVHAVAYNRLGMPLATGRMLEHVPGVAKIGRMAVRRQLRGSHVGRAVLDALMQAARDRGEQEVILHAQMSAEPFYRRAGFHQRGPEFEEAGIAHVEMVRNL